MGAEPAGTETHGAAMFHLSVLGAFRLTDVRSGADSSPKSRKARALVAYLALTDTGPVRRERLATLLWGDRPEEQARTNLRQTLFELREIASEPTPLLVPGRDSIGLNRALLESDTEDIHLLARARDIGGLQSALAHWQSGLLSDLDSISPEFDGWLAAARSRESEALMGVVLEAATAALDAGDPRVRAIVALLQGIDPMNERVLRLGLLADAKTGDSADLHRRYRAFVETLRNELNASPSAETRSLFRSLVPPDVERAIDTAPPRRALRRDPSQIVGRPASAATTSNIDAVKSSVRARRVRWGLTGVFAVAVAAAGVVLLLPSTDSSSTLPVPARAAASKPAIDPVAYELYRRGVEATRQRTRLAIVQAEALLENAVSRAPSFSRAWSALAYAQRMLADVAAGDGKSPQEVARWYRSARESANRAIALDPHNGEPYGILAEFVMSEDMEREKLRLIEKGLAIEPDSVYLIRSRGQQLLSLGLAEDALVDLRRAHRLDPLDSRTIAALSSALIDSGHVREARHVLDKGLAVYPLYVHLWRQKLVALLSDGEFDAADTMLAPSAARPSPEWERATPGLRLIARALRTRRPADVEAAMVPLRQEARVATPGDVQLVVWKMAMLGHINDAYAVIRAHDRPVIVSGAPWPTAEEEASSSDVFYAYELFVDVIFAPFRRDARFSLTWDPTVIIFWQKTGRWPTFCHDPQLRYDCKTEAAKAMMRR